PETPEDVIILDNEENWSEDHTVVNSPSNQSVKTVSVEKDHSEPADQDKNDDTNVVNVDDLVSEE
ncbi:hypothetical protein A2U01_0116397, partial [Trifolium medium]|nr:hypothetical protein [Trifolium medium]